MMQRIKQVQIVLPEGSFEGKCEECVHSCRTWQDKGNTDKNNREMYCAMYRKNFYPLDVGDINCSHYKMKLRYAIKRIAIVVIAIYIVITAIVIILGI